MIIFLVRIYVRPGTRQGFLTRSAAAVVEARRADGCLDFVVAGDPVGPDRVNFYEEWESEVTRFRFRGDGLGKDLSSSILRAKVTRHTVASSVPA